MDIGLLGNAIIKSTPLRRASGTPARMRCFAIGRYWPQA